ncbi:hypothetical protein [Mycolicibacterium sphagni]|uniref:DUF2530 domain-containing protein n=1 Tax=Mycolicibacterium sphagni TaxID=1786 RepID=A0A255DR97_9MYCO|nr:hypothetical protein [Mycolicibacterium sphagni]OYN81764.1 hypothetical protein CG716_05325 [Mycolicibacterium sphagni]
MNANIKKAAAAICLSVFGAAFLIVAGLWPETTTAVKWCAGIGWACALNAILTVASMSSTDE